MTLIAGMLASFPHPQRGALPTILRFQYNPTEVTRVFTAPAPDAQAGGARNAVWPPAESYSMTLEFDATDGLDRGAAVAEELGVSPRLAALEMLMQPVGSSLLGGLAGSLLGRRCAEIPAQRLPLTLFMWGPWRTAPVKLTSLTIRETAFGAWLNPIHATAELGFTVIGPDDPDRNDLLALFAAKQYQGAREIRALLQISQLGES